jgi:hypothetical protein
VLAITSRSPSQKRIHHPTITPADDDDQQQSKRVIDIIHIRQVPKGGKEIKRQITASIERSYSLL